MTRSPFPTRRRRPGPADDSRSSRPVLAVVDAPLAEDVATASVRLEPSNLVDVADALGAQMFSVVDGEVTFTKRSAQGERQWRGRLGSAGLLPLPS